MEANRISIVKRILKIFLIGTGITFLVFGIVTWVVVKKKNDWLLNQIYAYVKNSQSGQLNITALDLKLFRNFPRVTLELSGITYYEHWDSVRTAEEQPILRAEQLFVALELLPLLRDELNIEAVNLNEGQFSIVQYPDESLNIQRALVQPTKLSAAKVNSATTPIPGVPQQKSEPVKPPPVSQSSQGLQIELESLEINNLLVTINFHGQPPAGIQLQQLEASLVHAGSSIYAEVLAKQFIQRLSVKNTSLPPGEITLAAEIQYELKTKLLTIFTGAITYNDFLATLHGSYQHSGNFPVELAIDASSNDLELLSTLLKPEVLRANPDILEQGDIYFRGRVFGDVKAQQPQFDFTFGLKDLRFELPQQAGTISQVGFEGQIQSGTASDYSSASIRIHNLRGNLPGGFLKGQFRLQNFVTPYLQYEVQAKVKLDNYDQVFPIESVKNLKGALSMEASFDGPIKHFAGHPMDSSRTSSMVLEGVSFTVTKSNKAVSGLSAKIENRKNQATIQSLSFVYGESELLVNATVNNLLYFILDRENEIEATGSLRSQKLHTRDFILDTLLTAQVQEQVRDLAFDFELKTTTLPDSMNFTMPAIDFTIKNLSAKLDQLPDLKQVDAEVGWRQSPEGSVWTVSGFQAVLPHGHVAVGGDLTVPKIGPWRFNAKLKLQEFPWTYVRELVAEIKEEAEPQAKTLSKNEMDLLTADLDLSAAVITYPFDIVSLTVRDSRGAYSMPQSETISAENIDMTLNHFYFLHPENSGALSGLKELQGVISMKKLKIPAFKPFDITMTGQGQSDQLVLNFLRSSPEADLQQGQLEIDLTNKVWNYHLQFHTKQANLRFFIEKVSTRNLMDGYIDYSLDLKAQGSTWPTIRQSLVGSIELDGKDLHLYGVDIDDVLRKYEKSQNFNLTDLGAVVVAGPVGLAVTKGSDFVSLAQVNLDSTQQTIIKTLYAGWKFKNDQFITQDVAFATPLNRIAFDGRIDFASDSIPGLTIAVVDKNGCSLMDQKLYGNLNNLQHGKLNITKTLFGSVINFVNAVVGRDCKPVYKGKVPAPVGK